ncbi:UDP-glucose 4-epimerase GalE [Thiopseudomonas alkaliphila]|uniref:UDP-glucose 4-epimerase GalE n=1 Tax=Thiopseudomonas alkaliphila TaxID=1697053 RepID=UPI00069EE8A7|nr:UDP-glucose 4-epimerase GalE [Thiopseudomonas alkaliphila]AKX54029.1 UDP-galactose-4-epimerase [Thiopseudomonas alkaliphila]
MTSNILVIGGLEYISSYACVELLKAEFNEFILNNLSNSSKEFLQRVEQITGKKVTFINGDIRNPQDIEQVFAQYDVDAVIHFAGLKVVAESVAQPLYYYENNVLGTLNLLQVMTKHNCKKLVFSSSATVYGDPHTVPIQEDFPLSATNPYGRSKLMIEDMLRDLYRSDSNWSLALLRYFNPVGAHKSGLIGEDPQGIPNNLMPYIAQVAVGKREKLSVFGGDYPTQDGTGVRDYIHVVDLAKGHLKALEAMQKPELITVNLGTGQGYSVLEMVKAFEQASGKQVDYQIVDRRPGDIAACYADPKLALQKLGWKAELTLSDMCKDAWHWQSNNPDGYR